MIGGNNDEFPNYTYPLMSTYLLYNFLDYDQLALLIFGSWLQHCVYELGKQCLKQLFILTPNIQNLDLKWQTMQQCSLCTNTCSADQKIKLQIYQTLVIKYKAQY